MEYHLLILLFHQLLKLFISVSITPGAIAFTLIPKEATSFAKALVNKFNPPFVVEYTTSQEAPLSPHIEEILIILPLSLES